MTSKINNTQDLTLFLNQRETELEQLSNQISLLNYQRFVGEGNDPSLPELELHRGRMMLEPAFVALVEEWLPKVQEPILKRRLENIHSHMQRAQVEAQPEVLELVRLLNDQLVGYKYALGQERVDITGIRQTVRACPDRNKRRLAWLSPGELSDKLADTLLTLVQLRNAQAGKLGYATYADLLLEHSELSLVEAESMLQQLTEATNPVYQGLLEQGAHKLGLETIEPWDIQFILESSSGIPDHLFPREGIVPAVRAWAQSMGLDMDAMGIKMTTADIPYNGLCMMLSKNDIRILGNPADGYGYYKTNFHELGHAVHGAMQDQEYLSLRREASVFNEAMAEVFGYIPAHPRWLGGRGLSPEQVKIAIKAALGPQFHYLRQRTAYALFEYQLYRNPSGNLDQLLGETEAQVLGCKANGSPRWAANAWFINFPVYWQNYVLADVVASQVHHHLEARFGPLHHNQDAVDYVLNHYISPGATIPWRQKLVQATGQELTVAALVEDINRSS